MAVQTRIRMEMADAFPTGAFVLGEAVSDDDYEIRKSGVGDPQRRDKETGQRVWNVRVLDADPAGRKGSGEVTVKILADHQPVPPAELPGLPLRPVEFENLTVTPYVDTNGSRPRLAYSFRATAMHAPKTSKPGLPS